jgi:thymidylate synthase
MRNIETEYIGLLSGILYGGKPKADRTGVGTRAVFGRMIYHDMKLGFPLLTKKKIYFNNAKIELLWILSGRTDLAYLIDNGVNYWTPDYNRSGRTDRTLGPVYGRQWRNFNGNDQLQMVLQEIRENPTSRRLLVNAWNVSDLHDMVLPPCHYGFQLFINDGKLDLMWQQRSADVFLGLPYDICMYGLLLEMIAEGAKLKPGTLIGSLGDCHLYYNHLEQAEEFLSAEQYKLPQLKLKLGGVKLREGANDFVFIPPSDSIKIENYKHSPAIKADLSVGK